MFLAKIWRYLWTNSKDSWRQLNKPQHSGPKGRGTVLSFHSSTRRISFHREKLPQASELQIAIEIVSAGSAMINLFRLILIFKFLMTTTQQKKAAKWKVAIYLFTATRNCLLMIFAREGTLMDGYVGAMGGFGRKQDNKRAKHRICTFLLNVDWKKRSQHHKPTATFFLFSLSKQIITHSYCETNRGNNRALKYLKIIKVCLSCTQSLIKLSQINSVSGEIPARHLPSSKPSNAFFTTASSPSFCRSRPHDQRPARHGPESTFPQRQLCL